MRIAGVLAAAALALSGCAGHGAAAPEAIPAPAPGGPIAAAVDATISGRWTGTVLVARGDRVLWRGGVGAPDSSIPAPDRAAAFDIASMAKTLTAVAVLRLAQQNRIDLDAPLRRYLAELPASTADATVRATLDMNAGWPNYLSGDDMTVKTSAEALAEIAAITRERGAGTGYAYSNVGFGALGLLVERVSGKPFTAAMQDLLFRPAGMRRTGFFAEKRADVVPGYVEGKSVGSPPGWPLTWAGLGAGQVVSTVDDLHRFNRAVVAGGLLDRERRALYFSPGTDTRGRGPYRSPNRLNTSYGAGLFHWNDPQGRRIHMHGGATEYGYHSLMLWREDDDVLVVGLFNSGDPSKGRGEFVDAVLAAVDAAGGG